MSGGGSRTALLYVRLPERTDRQRRCTRQREKAEPKQYVAEL